MIVNGSCAETREHLSEHLEGELRGFRRWRVMRHLDRCDRCRAVLRSLAHTVEQLGSLGRGDLEPASSPSVADTVTERIRREER
jgi:predicted anti-sigma-YlaC factor YlaD